MTPSGQAQSAAMHTWHFTLIMDTGADDWGNPQQVRKLREAGLTDASFGTVAGDAYVLIGRQAESYGQAVGSAIDQIEDVTGRKVIGVQREPEEG